MGPEALNLARLVVAGAVSSVRVAQKGTFRKEGEYWTIPRASAAPSPGRASLEERPGEGHLAGVMRGSFAYLCVVLCADR